MCIQFRCWYECFINKTLLRPKGLDVWVCFVSKSGICYLSSKMQNSQNWIHPTTIKIHQHHWRSLENKLTHATSIPKSLEANLPQMSTRALFHHRKCTQMLRASRMWMFWNFNLTFFTPLSFSLEKLFQNK